MKTKTTAILMAALLIGAVGIGLNDAAAAPAATAAESPVGRLVDVQLVAWPLSTAPAGMLHGTLIAMTTGWLVIKEGSYEHWVPMEKVMSMRVSR
jgi:hypothetical protein